MLSLIELRIAAEDSSWVMKQKLPVKLMELLVAYMIVVIETCSVCFGIKVLHSNASGIT